MNECLELKRKTRWKQINWVKRIFATHSSWVTVNHETRTSERDNKYHATQRRRLE